MSWKLAGVVCVSGVFVVAAWAGAQGDVGEEGAIRGKLSRAAADMRVLRTALETYRIDNNQYPPTTEMMGQRNIGPGVPTFHDSTFRYTESRGSGVVSLSTPIAYLSRFPMDVFSPVADSRYGYYTTGTTYLIWSAGPDRKYDLDISQFDPEGERQSPEFNASFSYDPSNGLVSSGDLWVSKMDVDMDRVNSLLEEAKPERKSVFDMLAAAEKVAQVDVPEMQVDRMRRDMMAIGTALETYRIDHNAYPVFTTNTEMQAGGRGLPEGVPTFHRGIAYGQSDGTGINGSKSFLATLTTPISYLVKMPEDPFAAGSGSYAYYHDGDAWVVWSPGPDGKYDVDLEAFRTLPDGDFMARFSYDPSNGTVSGGDMISHKMRRFGEEGSVPVSVNP